MSPDDILEIASGACLVLGAAFVVIGALGLLRFPDLFARVHAASLIDTLGIGFLALGMGLHAGWSQVSLKLGFIVALVGLTSPVATHALAQAALHAGERPVLRSDRRDEGPLP